MKNEKKNYNKKIEINHKRSWKLQKIAKQKNLKEKKKMENFFKGQKK